jgi:hypothetical protein
MHPVAQRLTAVPFSAAAAKFSCVTQTALPMPPLSPANRNPRTSSQSFRKMGIPRRLRLI